MHECQECGRGTVALGDPNLCSSCLLILRAQALEGLVQLQDYLLKYSRYQEWCAEHRVAA